ncbi:MAG: tol-pal system YbgF family protein [Saprospiraceae bacterium]
MKPQNQQELIDQFLQKKLQGQELTDFMKKLNTDDSFAEEVESQRVVAKGIEHEGTKELRQRLKKIHQKVRDEQERKSNAKRIIIPYRRWIAAAAVVLLIVIGFNFWNSSSSNQELYSKYYQAYVPNFTTRADALTGKIKAENAYRAGNYKNAIVLLEELEGEEANDSRVLLGLGNASLNIDEYQSAIVQFNKIIQNNDELYLDQAKWYLALTYIKNGKIEESKSWLRQLANDETADFYKEAKTLLGEIEN